MINPKTISSNKNNDLPDLFFIIRFQLEKPKMFIIKSKPVNLQSQ
jgi:hypothetical protein